MAGFDEMDSMIVFIDGIFTKIPLTDGGSLV
jgi:hypothetical protein